MRLADFIRENTEEIIKEWIKFARSTPAGEQLDRLTLQDDVKEILLATAEDMDTAQTIEQQSEKSKGESDSKPQSDEIRAASIRHGTERLMSGFEMMELVSEYRALRASIFRLWEKSNPSHDDHERDEVTRFNESIDQSLAVAVETYTKQVERSHQTFLAILAHDLRSPLISVHSGLKLLGRRITGNEETTNFLSQMSNSLTAMDHLIGDLIDFSRSVVGAKMPLSRTATDLNHLCHEVINEIKTAYPEANLEFLADGTFQGNWDRARLRQVFSNLIVNAIEHGDMGQPIVLTLYEADSAVNLKIQNKGEPIPKEQISKLFKPFVPLNETRTSAHRKNAGLGLYITKEIVTAHAGTIEVESSPSLGTVFTVALPKDEGLKQ